MRQLSKGKNPVSSDSPQNEQSAARKKFQHMKNTFCVDENIEVEHTTCASSELDIRKLDFDVDEKLLKLE